MEVQSTQVNVKAIWELKTKIKENEIFSGNTQVLLMYILGNTEIILHSIELTN